jgi:hypothetical protein
MSNSQLKKELKKAFHYYIVDDVTAFDNELIYLISKFGNNTKRILKDVKKLRGL